MIRVQIQNASGWRTDREYPLSLDNAWPAAHHINKILLDYPRSVVRVVIGESPDVDRCSVLYVPVFPDVESPGFVAREIEIGVQHQAGPTIQTEIR